MSDINLTEVIARLRKKALHQLDFGRGRHVQALANDVLDLLSHIEGLERDKRRLDWLDEMSVQGAHQGEGKFFRIYGTPVKPPFRQQIDEYMAARIRAEAGGDGV